MSLVRSIFCTSTALMLAISMPVLAASNPLAPTGPAPIAAAVPSDTAFGRLPPPSVFAYPGKVCPNGTERYQGPEQETLASSGAVLCKFTRKVATWEKKIHPKCPSNMWPYTDPKAKPDNDVIWCTMDPPVDPSAPPTPPLSKATK